MRSESTYKTMDLHLVGGFLGSGKTTAIIQAAKLLSTAGKRVGIITNEQGKHLVDTGFIQAQDLPALEVTGGCICCHLDDFADRIDEISRNFNPEVIFAESVGSCTDLVATVIKPLTDYRKSAAIPASLSVFTDSRLLLRYLRGQEMPFSDAVIYIFEKQIEETELLIINKIDLLTQSDATDVAKLARMHYPNKVIRIQNSLEKEEVEDWLKLIESHSTEIPVKSLELDYDAYADGEGKFAWLDRVLELKIKENASGMIISELIREIITAFFHSGERIAHLKFSVESPKGIQKVNLTGLDPLESLNLEAIEELTGSPVTSNHQWNDRGESSTTITES